MRHIPCDQLSDAFRADQAFPYRIDVGETVSLDIPDCFGRFPEGEKPVWEGRPNPMVGPIAVDGVEAGDTIAVHIVDLEPVGDAFYGRDEDRTWLPIDRRRRLIRFPGGQEVTLAPHIGTIGVAPAEGIGKTTDAGDHGGNLDCTQIREGTVICFNANVAGAGLGLADVHAAMGDGESGGQGAEVAARASLCVTKVTGLPIERPYALANGRLIVIGWGFMMDAAADMAQQDMVTAVRDVTGFGEAECWKYLGSAADLRVCWRGARTPVMRMELPLMYLPEESRHAVRDRLGVT